MLTKHVVRGVKAGIVAGSAFGLFVALVGNPLIAYAETFETGTHDGGPAVSGAVSSVVSIAGGVVLGVLLGGVVFGAVFYFLAPAIPGVGPTKSYLLGAAGFITVSGAPWLALPPQPPGVEQGLPTAVRITWYLALMVAGAVACGLGGALFNRLRREYGRSLAVVGAVTPFVLVLAIAAVSPPNPVSGPIPDQLAYVFRTVTVAGQVGLWFVLASVHAWLRQRERIAEPGSGDRPAVGEAPGSMPSD